MHANAGKTITNLDLAMQWCVKNAPLTPIVHQMQRPSTNASVVEIISKTTTNANNAQTMPKGGMTRDPLILYANVKTTIINLV